MLKLVSSKAVASQSWKVTGLKVLDSAKDLVLSFFIFSDSSRTTVSDARPRTHGLGHTVSDTRSFMAVLTDNRTHGPGHTVSDSVTIFRVRYGQELSAIPHGQAKKTVPTKLICVFHGLGHTVSDTRSRTRALSRQS
jgi:hypothetical protein